MDWTMWRTCLIQDRPKANFFFWQSPILFFLPLVVGRLVKHGKGVGRKIERVRSLVYVDYGNFMVMVMQRAERKGGRGEGTGGF